MKYIKGFKESLFNNNDIRYLLRNNLPFLIDNGFSVRFKIYDESTNKCNVFINKTIYNDDGIAKKFKFSDVVDDLVPFLSILKSKGIDVRVKIIGDVPSKFNKYKFIGFEFELNRLEREVIKTFDVDDVIKKKFKCNIDISYITLELLKLPTKDLKKWFDIF